MIESEELKAIVEDLMAGLEAGTYRLMNVKCHEPTGEKGAGFSVQTKKTGRRRIVIDFDNVKGREAYKKWVKI